jgi:hypothetical protein
MTRDGYCSSTTAEPLIDVAVTTIQLPILD